MDKEAHLISEKAPISSALAQMNSLVDRAILLLAYTPDQRVSGSISDGDIRRGLAKGISLDNPVSSVMKTDFKHISKMDDEWEVIQSLDTQEIKLLPVLDEIGRLDRLIDLRRYRPSLPLTAFIQAGGRGTRLAPLTDTMPKPLLPIGDKPILGHLLAHLQAQGLSQIAISARYKAVMIQDYLDDQDITGVELIIEEQVKGTAGALKLKSDWATDHILMMNSDLLTDIDIQQMYRHFCAGGFDFMVASIPYQVSIPYAVLESEDEFVRGLKEKPRYTFQANAGIYLFHKALLDLIPDQGKFDATELIDTAIAQDKKVGYHSISSYWLDIGRHDDYERAQRDIKTLFT